MDEVRMWWDGIEAWLTGLSFLPQVLVVLAVLVPGATVAAVILNALVNAVMSVVERLASTTASRERR